MVILSFINGLTPEEIVAEFSSLELGNVYSVLGYYLHHKDDVHEYLRGRQEYSDAVWDKIEAHQSQNGLRDHLLARLKNSE